MVENENQEQQNENTESVVTESAAVEQETPAVEPEQEAPAAETKQEVPAPTPEPQVAAQSDNDDDDDAEEEVEEEEVSGEDFAAMLAESEDRTRMRVQAGQKLEGRVVTRSGMIAYIDIGMRSEASLPLDSGDERFEDLKEGDVLDVYVSDPEGQVEVSLDPIMGQGDIAPLEEAYSEGTVVEGRVSSLMSGGYEVNISGVRCFCPHSQMSLRGVNEPAEQIGKVVAFKVIDLDARKRNVVISHRVILEAEQAKQLEAIREKLVVGAVLKGTVRDIQSFGAFVDLGGIQGLLHISQIAFQNVDKVDDILSVGEEVDVKILEITKDNRGKDRISLSMKALLPDPWDVLEMKMGDLVTGMVARKSQFGIFIHLVPGIDGLLPRRMMRKAGQNVEMEVFNEGEEIQVEVAEVNKSDRKIALALPGWDEELKSGLKQGDTLKAEVVKILPVGILVRGLEDPARGLLHKRHLKNKSMKQIVDTYPIGSQIEVVLSEIDDRGRFNFVPPGDSDTVDRKTIQEFSSSEGLGHNPFASFFKEKK